MDALSDIITMLRPLRVKTGAADIAGPWAIAMAAYEGLFCYAILSGACWIIVEGLPPVPLTAGECAVLPSGRSFRIGSDPALPAVDAAVVLAGRTNGSVATYGGGGDCFLYAGHFEFARRDAAALLQALSPIVHIREAEAQVTLRSSLDRMMAELRQPQPGSDLIVQHLSHLVLIQALRLHLAHGEERTGWLCALADHRLNAALTAFHTTPSHPWSVGSLARVAGMSRTAFATRFRDLVGVSPMGYVTRWRMLVAAGQLSRPGARLTKIAHAAGYASDAAFSVAFKRTIGCSPRQHSLRVARTKENV